MPVLWFPPLVPPLAAEFNETPFDSVFQKLLDAIASKQNFETYMIKTIITDFRSFPKEVIVDADLKQAMTVFRKSFLASQQQLDTVVQKSLVPVKHTLGGIGGHPSMYGGWPLVLV